MITNISKKNLWIEDSGEKIKFDSLQDLKNYILQNFVRLALPYNPPLSDLWEFVLNSKYGKRDWAEGIEECGYNTIANGYVRQFNGEKVHHDCNIKVFGTQGAGDAFYAYSGKILIEFLDV